MSAQAAEHERIEDAELVEPGAELELRAPAVPATANLFGVDPLEVIDRASKMATVLASVLEQRELVKQISGRKHVLVEGWTMLGSMLGVFPVCVWSRPMKNEAGKTIGFEARVEARTRSGEVVGAAEAECTRDENLWSFTPKGRNGQALTPRDDFALRSMAQTRATAKALRLPLGFVVTLAGYDSTPAEEIDSQASAGRRSGAAAGGAGSGDRPAEGITDAQHRKIGAMIRDLEAKMPTHEGQKTYVQEIRDKFGVRSRTQLSRAQASEAIEWLQGQLDAAEIPFG